MVSQHGWPDRSQHYDTWNRDGRRCYRGQCRYSERRSHYARFHHCGSVTVTALSASSITAGSAALAGSLLLGGDSVYSVVRTRFSTTNNGKSTVLLGQAGHAIAPAETSLSRLAAVVHGVVFVSALLPRALC